MEEYGMDINGTKEGGEVMRVRRVKEKGLVREWLTNQI